MEGSRTAAPDSKKQATMTLEASPREEERLGSRHLRVVQRHLLFLPYDPYEIRYLRSLPLSPSNYLSVHPSLGCRGNVARRTHNPRCTGYNTTRNPRAARSFSRLFLLSVSLATRGLFFATGENVYICLLRQLTLRRTLRTKSVL